MSNEKGSASKKPEQPPTPPTSHKLASILRQLFEKQRKKKPADVEISSPFMVRHDHHVEFDEETGFTVCCTNALADLNMCFYSLFLFSSFLLFQGMPAEWNLQELTGFRYGVSTDTLNLEYEKHRRQSVLQSQQAREAALLLKQQQQQGDPDLLVNLQQPNCPTMESFLSRKNSQPAASQHVAPEQQQTGESAFDRFRKRYDRSVTMQEFLPLYKEPHLGLYSLQLHKTNYPLPLHLSHYSGLSGYKGPV